MSAIAGFADVSLLGTHTDGVLMVTGLGKLQNMAFIEALNQLKLSKTKVLGIAINKMTSS
jgi:Mrp family chromosome partitioning ATPase